MGNKEQDSIYREIIFPDGKISALSNVPLLRLFRSIEIVLGKVYITTFVSNDNVSELLSRPARLVPVQFFSDGQFKSINISWQMDNNSLLFTPNLEGGSYMAYDLVDPFSSDKPVSRVLQTSLTERGVKGVLASSGAKLIKLKTQRIRPNQ